MLLNVSIDPCDGSVHPSLQYVLIRGFTAMGWEQPKAASENIAMEILKIIRPSVRPDAGGGVRLPHGYALVPTKPTPAMIEAGCEQNPTQWNEGTDLGFAADVANDVYVAMVSAAALSTTPAAAESNASAEAIIAEIDTYSRVHGVLEDDDRERMAKLKGQIAALARQGNASVEARLRERVHFYRNHSDAPVYSGKHVANILETVFALSVVGDEAKKSEGGPLNWQLSDDAKARIAEIDANRRHAALNAGNIVAGSPTPSDSTAERREIDPKVLLLLQMVERAKGEIDTTEHDNSLLNFFCDDRGRETDTYNLAIDAGYLRSSFNDLFETSRAYLTDAGRAILAALDGGVSA
jgi:hypothetical protein